MKVLYHLTSGSPLCSNPFKYYTTAALALYMYDYLLTLPDEVGPAINPKMLLEKIRVFRLNTYGKAEKPGVSPNNALGCALRADCTVFYMFLAVSIPCLSYSPG